MNRRNTTFLIAAGLSVGIHAAVFSTFPRYEVTWAALEWPDAGVRVPLEMTIVLEPQPVVEPEPEPEPEPKKEPREFEMGEADGKGFASHEIPDKAHATAPEADADQAFLSLDPTGAGRRGTDAAVAKATGQGSRIGQPGGSPEPPREKRSGPLKPELPTPPRPPATVSPPSPPEAASPSRPPANAPPKAIPAPAKATAVADPKPAAEDGVAEPTVRPIEPLPKSPPPTPPAQATAPNTVGPRAISPTDSTDPTEPEPAPPARAAPPNPIEPRVVPPTDLAQPKPATLAEATAADPVESKVVPATVPTERKPAPTPLPAANDGGTRTGGAQQPAADPARMSDSESDPFSRLGTAVVSDGRLEIRFGRKVKTRRPKLLLAAHLDLLSLRRAQVVLKIDIDATGNVTSVEVIKSSGSNEIDQPTRVAVYEWWFEPKKNARGLPVADEVQFTIAWR